MSKLKPSIMLRVVKGALVPADVFSAKQLREKDFHIGDVISATLRKARNPKFHRKVHALTALLCDNIEDFYGYDAHSALKRLQWEGNLHCETMGAKLPGVGYVEVRIPRSLAFHEMDEGEFETLYQSLCHLIAERYWPDLKPEMVAEMAELMPEAA